MKRRILHVDDEETVRRFMKLAVQRFGWEVTSVDTAAAALAQTEVVAFDIVITDHEMPRATGLAVVGSLRAAGFSGRVFLLTGALSAAIRAEYARLGVDGIMMKPVSLETLRTVLSGNPGGVSAMPRGLPETSQELGLTIM